MHQYWLQFRQVIARDIAEIFMQMNKALSKHDCNSLMKVIVKQYFTLKTFLNEYSTVSAIR